MKLTPEQFGLLAKKVQYAVTHYPEPENKIGCKPSKNDVPEMMEWEQKLTTDVNALAYKGKLPSYAKLQDDHMEVLEWLIEYYTESK